MLDIDYLNDILISIYTNKLVGFSILIFILILIKRYFDGVKCNSKIGLTGKVAIVTGANTGIGFETALDFAQRDARVIIACRNLDKANAAAEKIKKLSKNNKVQVEKLDLSDLSSVRKLAEKMNSTLNKLDLLINNAGIMATPYTKTKDGFEMQFGTNHLGPFLLTNLLLPLLKKAEGSRIINVSSIAHEYCTMNWDDLNSEKSYSPMVAYARSKLANILFTRELAKRLNGSSVSVFSLHPGAVRTEITRMEAHGIYKLMAILKQMFYPIWYIFSKSAEQGAQTTIHCAITYEVLQYSGCYFSDCQVKTPSIHARNKDGPERLWKISEQLVNL